MFDFKIIFNYLSIPFFLLIFLYLLYLNQKTFNSLPKFYRNLLMFLRGVVIFLLFIILINPILKINNKYTYNKKLVFFIDNSKSMLSSIDDNFMGYLLKNVKKLNNKNINTSFYTFGDTITNINYLSDISFNALKYSDFYDYSIYTFQTESVDSSLDDISIKSVNANKIDDNYSRIKCDFEVLSKKSYDNIKILLSNELTKNQEVSSINLSLASSKPPSQFAS